MARCLLIALLVLLVGCKKEEIKITFKLSKDVSATCRVVYFEGNGKGGVLKETAVDVRGGKGELKLPVTEPTIVYLFSPSGKYPEAIIYGSPGEEFTVSGGGTSISGWKFKGNRTTEDLSEWFNDNSAAIVANDSGKLSASAADFARKNPDSPASAVILSNYFNRRKNEKEFFQLQNSLSANVRHDEELWRAISSADLATGLPDVPSIPASIVLKGTEGFADTLSLPGKRGSLLIYRNNGTASNIVKKDTLREMHRRSPGTVIAEFYTEYDSASWLRHIRRDTVEGISYLWLPLGVADSTAISMGIRRIPYFIVTDSALRETYRGDDWKKAIESFNKL